MTPLDVFLYGLAVAGSVGVVGVAVVGVFVLYFFVVGGKRQPPQ